MKRTAEDILKDKGGHLITIPADATVFQALSCMTGNKVGSILITENEQIIGIWTERDLMRNTLVPDFNPKLALVKDCMTENLITAEANEESYKLYDKFLGLRVRHLLIQKDGENIGLLSVGDVVKATLQAKTDEYAELNQMVSMEYYENWKEKREEQ